MINKPKLSNRLLKVSTYISEGAYFADIGSDHAYLPCYVCLKDPTAKAIAGEVKEGPFNSAKTSVSNYELHDRVEVRLGNGLKILKDKEVDHVVIAGMGGSLIKTILEEGKTKLSAVQRIIAQPNVDARNIRRWFLENDYTLTNEAILEENGHIYEVLVADKEEPNTLYSEDALDKELLFGPLLLQNKSAVFLEKWKLEHEKRTKVITHMKNANLPEQEKINSFEKELNWIEEVLKDEHEGPE
ncbi:tRNA (adenine(22)-N(1))-methyltransferase [Oceanobacillus saliphilus]|uniref:tRNA (adenine(22)-N(1))-methyltransferase n=1 Tax=Oceanobacillus saliphilus TaxID=2925834 RepID=UPI00201D95EB|nr:tRNA (adenine(22)-N(1))-methyltransferase TrmK [Oceanobacillus saliphilus]